MSQSEACLNCGAALTGPYCATCGQKRRHSDLTLREFLHETTQELTQLDGKVPHTLKTLFLEPGRLTMDFLVGRRARWLLPLRLYLICSVAYFLSDALAERITHRSERALAAVTVTNADGSRSLTPEGRMQLEAGLPARVFGLERMEHAIANNAQFNTAIDSAYPKAMFLLVPLFALLTHIVWRRKQPRYPAHLYLALHLHAAWFGAVALVTLATAFTSSSNLLMISGYVILAYVVWYGMVGLRRVFGDTWLRTIAKAVVIGIVYATCLVAASVLILGYAIAMM